LESLLSQSDIVTLHVPLDSTTRHLINRTSLAALRHGATIINASRGEVASTEALLRDDLTCLIDVWENEPNLDPRLLDKALVATTHIAGYSAQGKANATTMAVQALARHFSLPLTDWRPINVTRVEPKTISWEQMSNSISNYCDLTAESMALHSGPDLFESLRNNYLYREEYF
jgi:erythronate-4-phosphate dehydrogenase